MTEEKASNKIREWFEILNQERVRFVRLAVRFVGDSEVAEDIVQDSMIDFVKIMDKKDISNVKAYFSTIVKNNCFHYLKNKKHSSISLESDSQLIIENIRILSEQIEDTTGQMDDIKKILDNCKEQLPELTLKVFAAKRLEGLSYKEIAKKFDITERRVNTEIQKAQKVFREEFKDYRLLMTVGLVILCSWL